NKACTAILREQIKKAELQKEIAQFVAKSNLKVDWSKYKWLTRLDLYGVVDDNNFAHVRILSMLDCVRQIVAYTIPSPKSKKNTTADVRGNLTHEQYLLLIYEKLSTETVREMVLQCVQDETADNNPINNAIFFHLLNLNDILGADVVQHILSFVRTKRCLGVCKLWGRRAFINEQKNMKEKCAQFVPDLDTNAVIVDWNMRPLHDFEKQLGLQGPVANIGQALAMQTQDCKLVILFKNGVYRLDCQHKICNVQMISLAERVTVICKGELNYGIVFIGNVLLYKIHFVSAAQVLHNREEEYYLIRQDNYSTLVIQKCIFSSRTNGIHIMAGANAQISNSKFMQNDAGISIKVSAFEGHVSITECIFGGNYPQSQEIPSLAVLIVNHKINRHQTGTLSYFRAPLLKDGVTKMIIKNNVFCGIQWRNGALAKSFLHSLDTQHVAENRLECANISQLQCYARSNRLECDINQLQTLSCMREFLIEEVD
ncbi:MAG: hypothetical protein GY941_26895, partial [Planctomycetes bacterium]|nr:hypothetical protein [Planctomycetota bacterium]